MKSRVHKLINEAIENRGLIAEPFSAPEQINGHKTKVISVRENIIKIQSCDPITFLIKVMNGEPLPVHYIDEKGERLTHYMPIKAQERIRAAIFLADKIMPTMHLVKAVSEDEPPVKTGFDALVEETVNRGRRQITNSTKVLGSKSSTSG